MRFTLLTRSLLSFQRLVATGLLIFITSQAVGQQSAGKTTASLSTGWRFRQVGKDNWASATVPGSVHTDLLATKQIEDPLYRDNETKLQWIGKTDWEYETTFDVTPATLQRANLELVFKGLDTYTDVTLNDAVILHTDNMFREWRANVKSHLRAGANRLHIRFRSPLNEVAGLPAKYGYNLFAINDEQAMGFVGDKGPVLSPYTRKAPYHYGWDWGPRFVGAGVWQPVYLEAWDDAKLTDFHVIQRQISAQTALLGLEVEYEAASSAAGHQATLVLETTGPDGQATGQRIEQPVTLQPNRHTVTAELKLDNPKLWFPAGYGPQSLYSFRAQLVQNGQPLDEAKTRTGLRRLQLRREHDQYGKSFEFVVNGIPVFAKGANWIPADIFQTRVTNAKYRQLLQAAKDCNMNMLRVWGGGIYENQYFYDTCDEMGIMVWQDFLFACSFYPGNPEFMDNVRAEATYQVKRLRDHPSISIWVGNNENEVAWQEWGIPEKMGSHKLEVWSNYLKLYRDLLPTVLKAEDPSRPYLSSSPSAEFEDMAGSQTNGDMHYWQVWGGTAPISDYEKQLPRFMSEYGFQSFPELRSVKEFTVAADRDIMSPVMRLHQRSVVGNPRLKEYLLRDYKEPKDFESFLYVSQILQAHAIKLSAEHLRRNRPRTMGSMYWQLEDCWGVASWASIDYYGRWKALQYYAKRFYADVLVSPHEEGDQVRFYVVSDKTSAMPGQLEVRLLDFNGRTLFKQTQNLQIEPLTSKAYLDIPRTKLLGSQDPKKVVLSCELKQAGGPVLSTNTHYFALPKDMELPQPTIKATWKQSNDSTFRLTLQSKTLAREVHLMLTEKDGFFVDNYFDLLPGEKKELTFKSKGPITLAELRRQLAVRTLVDAF
ncbi:glycoside hydrolase family 2 protein [Hymenobacter sp. BT18]|uniref:beta-mannosidase n=1 Tax=Hymenobacter sp. BT18 TaxID=2835648 RepID=UPI00143E2D0A|nr:glycoside hydrolase family 2 protein [Hymenobacter sp. BT18]QIX60125.1 glycoside hydrolase family 2 protein [Hymenobacter sp. BT18]